MALPLSFQGLPDQGTEGEKRVEIMRLGRPRVFIKHHCNLLLFSDSVLSDDYI